MENTSGSFSTLKTDGFPAGLRVLVVDDDPTWLKILEKMLKKCSYEVTTCGLAREALHLLRVKKDGFDIVISDVNMPDMDGFKLLEHVGLEMDLPVIMMSVDGETGRVMKGVQHGACDYLLKPIRMKELRNIWQHVLRKRIHDGQNGDSQDGFDDFQMMRNGSEYSASNLSSGKKRKEEDKEYSDTSSAKKARVVWSIDLHQKFVKAVNKIGFDKVGPKKILDLMNLPGLTRENVASHLQKYRLYLSRLQKENELKATFGGINCSVLSTRDTLGNSSLCKEVKPSCIDRRTRGIQTEAQEDHKLEEYWIEPELELPYCPTFEQFGPITLSDVGPDQRNETCLGKDLHGLENIEFFEYKLPNCPSFEPILLSDVGPAQRNEACLGKDLHSLENIEVFDYNDPELLAAIPPSAYEALSYDYEYPFDAVEYPVMDQSLFIM